MNPTITDKDTGRELWRVEDCANHCNIGKGTWRTYVADGRAPRHIADFGPRFPLWDAEEVKTWHANRPGSPVKNHP
ncbi:hypothetical protein LJU02_08455 [Corynebacterium pseudotuberculosis]|nr:hypothetical protein [Corynebacterium pseudotuberculosis]AKS14008.1 Hypothetical protein CpE19_1670 [Corynebacterium pseudotuberculosis]AMN72380.1 hypothetical protein ATN03_08405 [Corynebacterium pseudotuberculosis]AMN75427.1 hypothetical protein ATN05_03220 [Corynebacterium pseudotuberculosis]APB11480.1 hypothetical protein A4R72_08615 [Corynebacterium pseudotuberculosis]APB13524.1 hypothetical protein A4R71_08630 [Corynebacterium pseudotuberculosis]